MRFSLRLEIILFADGFQEGSKSGNFLRVLSLADGEAFFGAAAPVLDARSAHLF